MSNTQSLCSILPAHKPDLAPGFSNINHVPGYQVPYGYPQHALGTYQGRLLVYRSGNKDGKCEV